MYMYRYFIFLDSEMKPISSALKEEPVQSYL